MPGGPERRTRDYATGPTNLFAALDVGSGISRFISLPPRHKPADEILTSLAAYC